ncbi:hypothetical protein H0H87_007992 [Tephrocybe sp. NHM501043]|nr:hypothetical protein H0H87_007992 [Tephrocybe sp. NHM501043]
MSSHASDSEVTPVRLADILTIGRTLNGCMTGDAKITRGYELPSSSLTDEIDHFNSRRYVIHTVGPIYSSNDVEEKARQLASCYRTSLKVAAENEARHIAFPSVSTGVYGYPIRDATRIALNEVRRFVGSELGQKLDRVIFVVWSNKDFDVYNSLVPEYFPPVQEQPKVTDNVADAESKKVEAEVPKAETAEAEEGERASDKMKAEQVGRPDSKED